MKLRFLFLVIGTGLFLGLFLAKNVQSEEPAKPAPDSFLETPKESFVANMKQLTFEGPRSGEGYFSQDGKKMIFQSERSSGNPFYQIFLMDLESGQTSKVSPGIGKTTCAWIHPFLKKAMYSSTHLDPMIKRKIEEEEANRKGPKKSGYSWSYDENFDIFESSLNGANGGANVKRLTTEKGYDAEGSYSPDGKKIVFASNRSGYTEKLSEEEEKLFHQDPSYMMDLYIMDADGKNVERLTNTRGYDGGPFFSQDGKFITWRRFAPNGQSAEIYTMDLKTREEKQITRLNAMSWAPFFHPSGDYIVFTSNLLGYQNFELFVVDSGGKGKPVRISHLDGFDGLPVFTPDGSKLSWTRRNAKGDSQIYIADWDDAKIRTLLNLPARISFESLVNSDITNKDLKQWLYYLTHPEFLGRATGSAEERIYTSRIAEYFKSLGLKPVIGNSFLVPFSFTADVKLGDHNKAQLSDAKKSTDLILEKEFLPMSFSANGKVEKAGIVFAGFGIKAPPTDKVEAYNSYKDLDVKGKWSLVLADTPEDLKLESKVHLINYSRVQHKAFVAKNEGAIGLIIVSRLKEFHPKIRYEGATAETSIPVIQISQKLANTILSASKKDLEDWKKDLDKGKIEGFAFENLFLDAEVELIPIRSEGINVVGQLVGSSNGATAIGAHGDHLGRGQFGNSLAIGDEKGQIHFGADDNASGVAALMEIAGKMSTQKNLLKNSVIFAVWSGEEIGLLGSHAFLKAFAAAKSPLKIKSYLNMDMLGRYRDNLNVQGVGSAPEWKKIIESLVPRTDLNLSLQEDPYVPSDGMEFYLKGIPMIMFFTGSHTEYHSPRDKAELVNYAGLEKVSQLAYLTSLDLSRKDPVLTLTKAESSQRKLEGRSFRTYLGTIPDYAQEGVKGVKISGTSKGSPAERAGLQPGDIILELGGVKIENLYDYVYCLQAVKPNSETSVKIQRNAETLDLKITPLLKE